MWLICIVGRVFLPSQLPRQLSCNSPTNQSKGKTSISCDYTVGESLPSQIRSLHHFLPSSRPDVVLTVSTSQEHIHTLLHVPMITLSQNEHKRTCMYIYTELAVGFKTLTACTHVPVSLPSELRTFAM